MNTWKRLFGRTKETKRLRRIRIGSDVKLKIHKRNKNIHKNQVYNLILKLQI